jgi:hypothetical protein
MLRVTEDEHGDAHGEHVEARISARPRWCRGVGVVLTVAGGAGDAVVVMVNVAAGCGRAVPGPRE